MIIHFIHLMHRLENDAKIAVDWFAYNDMKLNPDKGHILTSGFKHEIMIANVEKALVIEAQKVRLLGIDIDTKLSFSGHIESICKKAGKKLNALSRQCTMLPLNKRKILMTAFFISQFSYWPLVWVFCSRGRNNKINNLHYRSLQIVYRDFISTFQQLLEKDGAVTIHHRNIRLLATEMYKVSNGIASPSMSEIFGYKNGTVDNVSSNTIACKFYNPVKPKTTNYGLETLRHLAPKIWNILPVEIKNVTSLQVFRLKIKTWIPINCPCRICATYIPSLVFI